MKPYDWVQLAEQAIRRCQASGVSREEAEDCVHDAVVAFLLLPENSGEIKKVGAWLAVAARNRAIDRARRARREHAALGRLVAERLCPGPEEEVTERALALWLAGAVDRLPAGTRRVCAAIAAGRTSDEAAADLGITRRAVDSQLCRARRALRRLAAIAVAALAGGVTRFAWSKAAVATAVSGAVAATAVVSAVVVSPPPGHSGPAAAEVGPPAATVHSGITRPAGRPGRTAADRPRTVVRTPVTTTTERPVTTVTAKPGPENPAASVTTATTANSSARSGLERRLLDGGPTGPSGIELPDVLSLDSSALLGGAPPSGLSTKGIGP